MTTPKDQTPDPTVRETGGGEPADDASNLGLDDRGDEQSRTDSGRDRQPAHADAVDASSDVAEQLGTENHS